MGLKICFLLLLSALITFAQENNYRRIEQQSAVDNFSTESIFPINKVNTGSGVWIELNPKVPRVDYLGVHFINPDTGWAVGASGSIIKTTDGGENWLDRSYNTNSHLLRLDSFNGQVIIISGNDGIILRSSDGGENWEEVESGVTTQLWQVQMVDDTLGWVVGPYGTLLKTINGGKNWQKITIPDYSDLDYWALNFFDYNIGYISCNGGQVLKTLDGGENWNLQITGDPSGLYSIVALDSIRAVTGGNSGNIYYTTNGGNNWILSTNPLPLRVESISFANDTIGFAVGNISGVIHKTTNAGMTWEFFREIIGEFFISFVTENVGYNVGRGLKVFKSTDQGNSWERLILNNTLYDVFFTSDSIGWISAGPYYNDVTFPLFRTTDGGMNWDFWEHFPYDTLTSPIYTMKFLNQFVGFLGAGNNGIYKTTDGGYTWNIGIISGLTDTLGHINRFFFYDSLIGWSINSRGGIIKTTDGGLNWFAQLNHFLTTIFQSVNFIDSLHGWAVGTRSFETTDGGNTWIQRQEFDFQTVWDVYFKNNIVGWMFGDSLSRTDDGGETWRKVPNTPVSGGEFEWVDIEEGYITGGAFYKTTDSGETWQNIPYESGKAFSRFSSPIKGLGWGVVGKGLIMKFDERITGIKEKSVFIPHENILYQNYPNPFNPVTVIEFEIPQKEKVLIEVFDLLGKRIKILLNEEMEIGRHKINFNAVGLSSGIYFYRIRTKETTVTKKMVLLR